ncbi:hypothetical protein B0T16DRAFT_409500 [Cercophora newfieldiana]|uniref:Uncharacterized protein n=1 Tax=Cercophora newfieldiana TaxID=92897 RepID=A0AA39YCV5_9PEZI|nr:hypothetical protein B0T16DRAFT_409500 [Cercophora newfieldiana]
MCPVITSQDTRSHHLQRRLPRREAPPGFASFVSASPGVKTTSRPRHQQSDRGISKSFHGLQRTCIASAAMVTPSYPLTRFTPAPSCGVDSSLWAVTKSCYLYAGTSTVLVNPPWKTCTAAQMGEPPEKRNPDCYTAWRPPALDANTPTTYFSACPVGYSAASTETFWPYLRTSTVSSGEAAKTQVTAARDVQGLMFFCCPSASGFEFGLDLPDDFQIHTVHDGVSYSGYSYVIPRCRATAMSAQTVTLTPFSNTFGGERRRQEETAGPLITEVWDRGKKVYAEAETFMHTVFADGHTCYGTCDKYWESQYTSPTGPLSTTGVQLSIPTRTETSVGQGPAPTSAACHVKSNHGWSGMFGGLLLAAALSTLVV